MEFSSPKNRNKKVSRRNWTPMIHYLSLCSICVIYGTPCHVIGHQILPTQPCLGEPV